MQAQLPRIKSTSGIQYIATPDMKTKLEIPFASASVKAGFPSAAEDFMEGSLDLNEFLIKHKSATFFVGVDGQSMEGAGIYHDDVLIVDRAIDVDTNDIVVAIVDGEMTVKRYVYERGKITLVAENDDFPDLPINKGIGFDIWGVVLTNLRRFRK